MVDQCVVNASPLILLGKIEHLVLLPELYAEIVIPQGVAIEIQVGPEEEPVQDWLTTTAANWIREVGTIAPVIAAWDLGLGESEVLTWAYQHPEYEAIVDDRAGRNCAGTLGLRLRGTLGVILLAKKRGIIDRVNPLFQQLIQEGFRVAPNLLQTALDLAGERE